MYALVCVVFECARACARVCVLCSIDASTRASFVRACVRVCVVAATACTRMHACICSIAKLWRRERAGFGPIALS